MKQDYNYKLISGNIVDVLRNEIFPGTLVIDGERIVDIQKNYERSSHYILPGFVDSHLHVESTLLVPSELARIVSVHGTIAIVSDPHEITNVLGTEGVKYMLEDSKRVPVRFYFGAPPCVPASEFETGGAVIGVEELEELFKLEEIKYLAEVMNFPAVINRDLEVIKKIELAKKYKKAIDGHAPKLRGLPLSQYISAGISTDHESLDRDEALEKINLGMKIMIRKGSAARNFDEFVTIIEDYPYDCMFCTDDINPKDLLKGHINLLVKRALEYGIDLMKVLRVACVNPVLHYNLDVGLLQKGDPADFIVVDDLVNLNILETYSRGRLIASKGVTTLQRQSPRLINNFQADYRNPNDFLIPVKGSRIKVIEALDGQLITNRVILKPKTFKGYAISDIDRDILKIVVINRYHQNVKPSLGFVKGFNLKKGAMASSIAHDSHNIIALGVTDEELCRAINLVIKANGGMSVVSEDEDFFLPLPVAGLMSDLDYYQTAHKYAEICSKAKKILGSTLESPFMTLSFMALTVIPTLKISDKGLFDVELFKFVELFTD